METINRNPNVAPGAPGYGYGGQYDPYEPRIFGIPHRLISPRHLVAAIICLIILIFAAVGLGQLDWYVIENTNAAGLYTTWFFGLNYYLTCPFPKQTLNGQYPQYNAGFDGGSTGAGVCTLVRYKAARKVGGGNYDPFYHLEGASGIIIALLSLLIVVAFVGMLINFIAAFHRHFNHSFRSHNKGRHHRAGKGLLIVCLILELLVIIFWITIFPYRYWYDQRNGSVLGTVFTGAGYDSYFTLGTGFSVQIAGFFLALLGCALLRRRYNDDNTNNANNRNVALPNQQHHQQQVQQPGVVVTQPAVVVPANTV